MKKRTLKNRILALATCTLVLISSLMLPIGATEEETEKENIEKAINSHILNNYPDCNWITYPYEFSQDETFEVWGVTVTTHKDGSITLNGYAEETIKLTLAKITLPKGTYFLSGMPEENNISELSFEDAEGNIAEYDVGAGVLINWTDTCEIEINLWLYCDDEFSDFKIYPMLNKGTEAKPYQPYLPYYLGYMLGYEQGFDDAYDYGFSEGRATGYQSGYNQGYNAGYTEGALNAGNSNYKEGYNDALNNIEMVGTTIWEYANILCSNVHYKKSEETTATWSQSIPNIPFTTYTTNDGTVYLDTSTLFDYIKNYITEKTGENILTIASASFNISFKEKLNYFNKKGEYNGLVTQIHPETHASFILSGYLGNSSYETSNAWIRRYDNETRIEPKNTPQNTAYEAYLLSFIFMTNNKDIDVGTKAQTASEAYKSGYAQGYLDAADTEYTELLNEKYTLGYNKGFTKGKEEGLTISKNGNWTNLFTAVTEAPITAFQSLFNFEILGLDMRAAFGSMLAICVLLIIIKKVIL